MSHSTDFVSLVMELEEAGLTRREQAARVGMPYSTYMRRLSGEGLIMGSRRRSRWTPWSVSTHHNQRDPIARRLRWLIQAAKGDDTKYRGKRAAAIQWARDLVDRHMDVTYSQERGFREVPASPGEGDSWYLKDLLTAAERHVLSLPQLDDLEGGDPI